MGEAKASFPEPGADDRIVVAEMLRDPNSGLWYECDLFVKQRVYSKAKNIPQEHLDDIVQDAMIHLRQSLPTFQYRCKLKTWIVTIINNCIVDAYRKYIRAGQFLIPLGDEQEDVEREADVIAMSMHITVEDECIVYDELRKAVIALREYVSSHTNPTRNARILELALFEAHSYEEVAKVVGCSAPVVGYVVRSAQRYVRETLGYHLKTYFSNNEDDENELAPS